jgi:formylglycine-generating enzyme required for sulfatase activity
MKPAPRNGISLTSAPFAATVAVALGATLFGAAYLNLRGPDMTHFPAMIAVPSESVPQDVLFVQAHEITIDEWNTCYNAGGCTQKLRPPSYATDGSRYPATGLNWMDANEYLTWINHETRHSFRLPTTKEWHALAQNVMPEKADPIFTDPELSWASTYLMDAGRSRRLEPSGTFSTTDIGIADLDGNVWEWTQDCYAGSAGTVSQGDCPAFYVAGEHEAVVPYLVRDPARGGCAVGAPPAHLGLRLVTDVAFPIS